MPVEYIISTKAKSLISLGADLLLMLSIISSICLMDKTLGILFNFLGASILFVGSKLIIPSI